MKPYVIIGAGGFGRETAWLIKQSGGTVLGFLDDRLERDSRVMDLPIMGPIREVSTLSDYNVVVAIADPSIREKIVLQLPSGVLTPSLFHPRASVGGNGNRFGHGCIVTEGVILTTDVSLGNWVIVNLATTIGHDANIGDYCSIMPQCSISGNVTLGKGCYIGAGARILQGITLGEKCVVGAGAVVTKSYPAGSTLVGVPAHLHNS